LKDVNLLTGLAYFLQATQEPSVAAGIKLRSAVLPHSWHRRPGIPFSSLLQVRGAKRYLVRDRDATYGNEFRRQISRWAWRRSSARPGVLGRMHSRSVPLLPPHVLAKRREETTVPRASRYMLPPVSLVKVFH